MEFGSKFVYNYSDSEEESVSEEEFENGIDAELYVHSRLSLNTPPARRPPTGDPPARTSRPITGAIVR